MTHRISPDQFHHPLEEITHLEKYLANREYMNQWNNPVRSHVVGARRRDEAEQRLMGLDALLPTVGPYL